MPNGDRAGLVGPSPAYGDDAYLVQNFENLNPANTPWSESRKLWPDVDHEAQRFLDFERWWGGHVNLNVEEIRWIVDLHASDEDLTASQTIVYAIHETVDHLGIVVSGGGAKKEHEELAFTELRRIRAGHRDMSLEEFKRAVREQYFSLLLDEKAALAAIPGMLPPDREARERMLDAIRAVVGAAGTVDQARADRLERIAALFRGAG